MAGSTHGLCMSLYSVQVFLFSSVTYSAVVCSGGPLPVTLCRVCNADMTIPPVGRRGLVLAQNCLVNYLILGLWRGQNAHHLSV